MKDYEPTLKGLSALSQETRLLAFRALMEAGLDGMTAGALAEKVGVPPNSLSNHLLILSHAGLVTSERKSRNVIYRADIQTVSTLISDLIETCCNGHPEVCATLSGLHLHCKK